MKERMQDAAIGLAAIAAILLMSAMLLSFGSFRGVMQGTYPATIRLDQAAGLRYGSQVTLDGVPIGRIDEVALDMTAARPVTVHCEFDDWARIPVEHEIMVEKAIIGGGTILAILSQSNDSDRLVFQPDEIPELAGEYQDIGAMLSSILDARMGPIVDSFDTFQTLAATYAQVGERVNGLLDEGRTDEGSIGGAIVRVNNVLEDAQSALQLAAAWLDDEQLREDFGNAVFKASMLIERSTDAIGQAGKLAETLDIESSQVAGSLVSTADAIDLTLGDIRGVLKKASEGPGTVSRLLGDDTLYEDLNESIRRLESTLAAIQTMVEAINEEGLNVDF